MGSSRAGVFLNLLSIFSRDGIGGKTFTYAHEYLVFHSGDPYREWQSNKQSQKI